MTLGMVLLRRENGFSLVLVLVMMVILGLSAAVAGQSWSSLTRRAREADLLWKGAQIRAAIAGYYETQVAGRAAHTYPTRLQDLLRDPRSLQTRRYLRRLYPDPMTGADWVLIKDPAGRIRGVHSTLDKEPFKQDGFSEENRDLKKKNSYTEWEFVYQPQTKKTSSSTQQEPSRGFPFPQGATGSEGTGG